MILNPTINVGNHDPSGHFSNFILTLAKPWFEASFPDPITLNVEYVLSPITGLGTSNVTWASSVDYATLRALMIAHAQSSFSKGAMATLPEQAPVPPGYSFLGDITTAQAKLYGLIDPHATATDIVVYLNSAFVNNPGGHQWDWAWDWKPVAGDYKAQGTTIHETLHAVRQTRLGVGTTGTPEDLFRWSAKGVRDLTPQPAPGYPNSAVYFSPDGGATNEGVLCHYQLGSNDYADWYGNIASCFNYIGQAGIAQVMQLNDWRLMACCGLNNLSA